MCRKIVFKFSAFSKIPNFFSKKHKYIFKIENNKNVRKLIISLKTSNNKKTKITGDKRNNRIISLRSKNK